MLLLRTSLSCAVRWVREFLSAGAGRPELAWRALIKSAASRLELCAAKGAGDEGIAGDLDGDRLMSQLDHHIGQSVLVVQRLLLAVRDYLNMACSISRWIFVYAPLTLLEAGIWRAHRL